MPKFGVELSALANMRQYVEIEADSLEEAQDKAIETAGDRVWTYTESYDAQVEKAVPVP